ncbi:MAG: Holliday junction branch migration protein RuvA [Woeseiaceae bacterium]|nr:Holliday junction branch migration protein RuvA [Woeseiaceae bacterium]
MIGMVSGLLTLKQPPQIVVDCGGVGYEIETPMSTFLNLPAIGKEVRLHTHLLVREDAQILFGFATEDEKLLFRTLLKVSGVGAKMALSILSAMSVADFARCVRHEDSAMLVRIPGVGRKTAERLIIEMRDRLERAAEGLPASQGQGTVGDARAEAFDALAALGYKPKEINRLLGKMDTANMSSEDIIRQALRQTVGPAAGKEA